MDTARDLACADVWQASLERSLARRGKSTRSSLELFNLRPERDLSCVDILRESASFSQMRRSAVARRPAMSLPGAGGISALALLAATTLPGLLGGRGGGARTPRITYRADAHASRLLKGSLAAAVPTKAATLPGTATVAAVSQTATAAAASAPPSRPAVHSSRPATVTHTPRIAVAHDAAAGGAAVSRSASGGAVPAAQHSVAAATTVRHVTPTVDRASAGRHTPARTGAVRHTAAVHRLRVSAHHAPAVAKTAPAVAKTAPAVAKTAPAVAKTAPAVAKTHLVTGGGAIEEATPVGHPRTTTPAKPQTQPVAKPHPVATTPPPATKPAPAPAVAPGSYVNPLAGASVTPERIDQGVDYSGSGTLGAIGAGKVTETNGGGWPGTFIEYQLSSGPDAGRYVYYAEGVSPAAGLHVGEALRPGQPVAQIIPGSSTGIEIGWGSGVGSQPLAQALGQWSGGDDANSVPSPAGKDFSSLIAQLGGPPGKVEG
jgi:hypothetical protein